MNSNKSERNICKKVTEIRADYYSQGIDVGYEVIVSKGSDRDIDREAITMLINQILLENCDLILVNKATDLTTDLSDLEEFVRYVAEIGVSVFELSTGKFYHPIYPEEYSKKDISPNYRKIWCCI